MSIRNPFRKRKKSSSTKNTKEPLTERREGKSLGVGKFFSKIFFWGIILVLFSIVVDDHFASNIEHIDIIVDLFKSVGVALIVASTFSHTLGTKDFLNYIRDRLISIVLSKEFVTRLNPNEQRNLLHMVLKPSKEVSKVYSGVSEYFDQYVEESMQLASTCYRGHMVMDAVASFNQEKSVTQITQDSDYIIYRIADSFDPLVLFLDNENFEHIETKVIGSDGLTKIFSNNEITPIPKEEIHDPDMEKGFQMIIPDDFQELNHVNITRRIVEYGNDHWQVFSFKMIKPCHKLTISLRCEDDLVIRDCHTYGAQEKFTIFREETFIRVKYHDWLSPGFGVAIIVAKKDYH